MAARKGPSVAARSRQPHLVETAASEAVMPASLPLRAKSGILVETAARATEQKSAALGTPSELARCEGRLELTADMGLAELPLKYLRPRLALLEVGEDCVSEIAQEQHVSLAQFRPPFVCQTPQHV